MSNIFLALLANGTRQWRTAATTSTANAIVSGNAQGIIDSSWFPPGIGDETIQLPVSEDISAGKLINWWLDDATMRARLADASNGRAANGFVLASYTSGQTATIYTVGRNTAKTGLSADANYFLGTAGDIVDTPNLSAGYLIQPVGESYSTTAFFFLPEKAIPMAS